jgi:predicted nucleic acid-binding protein
MKTIVDTCVWSLALRRQDQSKLTADQRKIIAELQEAIRDGRAILLGPIRQEILSGVRDKARFAKLQGLLDPFLDEEIEAHDFVEAARLFNLCKDHGFECGATDVLICAVAARLHYDILTYDQGLKRCIQILRAESRIPNP